MIPVAFVTEYPCRKCEHGQTTYDELGLFLAVLAAAGYPPYSRCRLSLTDGWDCELMLTIARICDRAEQLAALIAREPDRRLRAEEASAAADGYADLLYGLGAVFDDTAFFRACHTRRACRVCEERKAGDRWTVICESCEKDEVAP